MVSFGLGGPLRLVCFELRAQEFALPIADVREILLVSSITWVFLILLCLAGVFSLRGDIVSVIDLGVLLGLLATAVGYDSKIVVVDCAVGVVGIVVDRLRDLRTVELSFEFLFVYLFGEVVGLFVGMVAILIGSVRVLDARSVLIVEPLRYLVRVDAEGRMA